MQLLQISGLAKGYAGGRAALEGVDLMLENGCVAGLLGPEGAGKTTLLKTVAGLLVPDKGALHYPGDAAGLAARHTVSFMPDMVRYPSWMRVEDAFAYQAAMYPDHCAQRAGEIKERLELAGNALIRKLSGEMQQRVTLALTFSRRTSLYLLDEPFGGIDSPGKRKALDSLLSMQPEESATLLSTSQVKNAEPLFDRVYFLLKGKIVLSAACGELRAEKGMTVEQAYLEVTGHGAAD